MMKVISLIIVSLTMILGASITIETLWSEDQYLMAVLTIPLATFVGGGLIVYLYNKED